MEIFVSLMFINWILLLVGNEIGQLWEVGKFSDIIYGLMDNKFDELVYVLGGCERLVIILVFFVYILILQCIVYLFCMLLLFVLVGDLYYMMLFVLVFIFYIFLLWDLLVEELEDLFGIVVNDLLLNVMCNIIECNLFDMIGQYLLLEMLCLDCYFNLI